MRKNLLFLAVAAMALAGCHSGGFENGQGGMLYSIPTDNGGTKISVGDFVSFNMIVKTEHDSVIVNTYEKGHASYIILPKAEHAGDMNDALKLLAEGDSAVIKINIDSVYGIGRQRPPFPGHYIVYNVKIEKVIPKAGLGDTEFNGKITAYTDQQTDLEKKAEPGKIKKYITDNNLKGTTTPSGLFYAITQPGAGDKPQTGDTVVMNYVVRLLSNTITATSMEDVAKKNKKFNPMAKYAPFSLVVGAKDNVPAWDEGFRLLNKGAKATLVSPSSLAHIGLTLRKVQWATPLVFNVEVLDIRHPKAGTVTAKPAAK